METSKKCAIVGLDLSLTGTGFTILSDSGFVMNQRSIGYSLKRDVREKEHVERMLYIARSIITSLKSMDADKIYLAIENFKLSPVSTRGKMMISSSTTGLAELHGVVKSQLWLGMGIEVDMVTATAARKVVCGRGNISKKDILPVLEKRLGIKFIDHNTADAYVIAEYERRKIFQKE